MNEEHKDNCHCFLTGTTCTKTISQNPESKNVFVLMPFENMYFDNFQFAI